MQRHFKFDCGHCRIFLQFYWFSIFCTIYFDICLCYVQSFCFCNMLHNLRTWCIQLAAETNWNYTAKPVDTALCQFFFQFGKKNTVTLQLLVKVEYSFSWHGLKSIIISNQRQNILEFACFSSFKKSKTIIYNVKTYSELSWEVFVLFKLAFIFHIFVKQWIIIIFPGRWMGWGSRYV